MSPKIKSILTFLVGWPLSIIALFFIFRTFLPRVHHLDESISQLNIWLLLIGIICFLGYYGIRGVVWHMLLEAMNYAYPLRHNLFYWSSSEIKRYIPGNIWSFLGRSVLYVNKGMTKKDIAKALIVEQEIILLGAIIASVMGVPFLTKWIVPALGQVPYLYHFIFLLLVVGLAVYICLPLIEGRLPKSLGILKSLMVNVTPTFPAGKTLWMICLSTIAFVFFGLGYYFVISAFVFLHPQDIWSLSGYFIISLLIGLFSFFTPTGLGVREGAITLGLRYIIALDIAAFASLAGRVFLVFSEVVFLCIAVVLSKIRERRVIGVIRIIREHIYEVVLGVGIAIFSVYFSVVSVLRYDNFYTGRFDLGNMDQTVWNTAQGRIFELTNPNGVENVSRLAFHADFILVFFAPLYWLWSDPRVLLIVQAVVVGLGAGFIYKLADEVLKSHTPLLNPLPKGEERLRTNPLPQGRGKGEGYAAKLLALALAFSYLLNPSVHRATIYDFHAVTLATTLLLGAFYFAYTKKYVWFVVFAVLAGITKEQIWVITALMGVYIIISNFKFQMSNIKYKQKNILVGVMVFIVSIAMFYYLIWHGIPGAAKSSGHFALNYFSEGNESPSALIKNIFFHPADTFSKITAPDRIAYFKKLFIPLGWLPLLAPYMLIFPGADLALNLLSDKGELHTIYYQYTAAITPFLYIGAIFGIRTILRLNSNIKYRISKQIQNSTNKNSKRSYLRKKIAEASASDFDIRISNLIAILVISMAIYGAFQFGPLPGSREPNIAVFTQPRSDKEGLKKALTFIKQKDSVAASNSLGAHLSQREHIYVLPHGVDKADIVVFSLNDRYNSPSNEWHKGKVQELLSNPNYDLKYYRNGVVVFRRLNK